jgi:hypothetical protein
MPDFDPEEIALAQNLSIVRRQNNLLRKVEQMLIQIQQNLVTKDLLKGGGRLYKGYKMLDLPWVAYDHFADYKNKENPTVIRSIFLLGHSIRVMIIGKAFISRIGVYPNLEGVKLMTLKPGEKLWSMEQSAFHPFNKKDSSVLPKRVDFIVESDRLSNFPQFSEEILRTVLDLPEPNIK